MIPPTVVRPSSGIMNVFRRTLSVLLIGCCAFLAAYVALRSRHSAPPPTAGSNPAVATPTAPTGTPTVATNPPAPESDAESNAATNPIPQTLPDARVPDLSGTSKSLRDFLGHPLIVNFWATWCEPCRREMPLLEQLQRRHQAEGLQVVGVAVDSRAAVQQFLHTRPIDYPILAGETEGTEAMNRFGAQPVLPFSVFTDAQGRIILLKLGELHPDEADYILSTEQAVAAGQESIAQARTAITAKLRDLAVARAKAGGSEGHVIR